MKEDTLTKLYNILSRNSVDDYCKAIEEGTTLERKNVDEALAVIKTAIKRMDNDWSQK